MRKQALLEVSTQGKEILAENTESAKIEVKVFLVRIQRSLGGQKGEGAESGMIKRSNAKSSSTNIVVHYEDFGF